MKCSRCQSQNREGLQFCEDCGARLPISCPRCAADVPAGKNFCGSCGAPTATRDDADAFDSPGSYIPKHLAEKILTSKDALEGERKLVTVLFADMQGSLEMLADRDPEEAREILDPVLQHMMEAVHHYEGTVNQVMGDGIMALFGAPIAHEDHAVRACYAALRMREAVESYAQNLRRSGGVDVQIRIGINSGEVVVRSISSDLKMDYSAVGQTTHLAARMEQLTAPGTIRLTRATARLVEGYVDMTALGEVPVKGLPDPVGVYELTGVAAARTRLEAKASRALTRFVGRELEIQLLGRALEQADKGHGQIVAIVGDPGVGKSRLVYELTRSNRTHGWLIRESASVSYSRGTSYLPIIHLIKTHFGIEDRDNYDIVRDKVQAGILGLDGSLKWALPPFLSLLDVPVEDDGWQALDPVQRRRRTIDAVKHWILRESQVRPVLVVFEDLHWTDSETQAVLDSLVDGLSTARILLLTSWRPEYRHGWVSKSYYIQLRVDPLPAAGCDELLYVLLGDDVTLRPLKQLLADQTQGNPFFLEESVRTLIETGALVGERAAYRLAKNVATIDVPPTVQAILAARIDRLAVEEKRLLQAASVVGKDVPLSVLRIVAALPDAQLEDSLTRLQATEFLHEATMFPDRKYAFKHALTHEVAYGSLVHSRRVALHERTLEALEMLHADRLTEPLDQLAHHALRGEVWEKALTYLSLAGAKAAARSANREAVAYFEKALVALRHVPERPDLLAQAVDLRLNLRNAFLQLGEPARIIEHLREAECLAERLQDDRCMGRVQASMAHYYWLTGKHDRAMTSGQEALLIAKRLGDLPLQITTGYYLGLAAHSLGRYPEGARILRANVESLHADLLHESFGTAGFHSVFARGWLVWCLAELGSFAEAVSRADEAVRIADAADEPFSLIQAYLGVGGVHIRIGDFERATSALEQALDLCRVADIRVLIPRVAASLGYAYTLSGRVIDALPLLERAVEQAFAIPVIFMHASSLAWLGEAYLRAGRLDDAMGSALRALEHARQHHERGNEAWTLRLIGEILARRDPPDVDKASDSYRQAMALAEELGMRPLTAHCLLGLATLLGHVGKAHEAREHLSAAATLFGDMDMKFWLERATAAQGQTP